jgi:putative transposase
VQRWVAGYRRAGLGGLVRLQRADRGQSRLPGPVREVIEGLALQRPRRPVATVHRQAAALATERGWLIPTYRQTLTLVRQLDPSLVLLAHEGAKAHAERFDLVYRREASTANALWQADHTPLDLWIRDEVGDLRSWSIGALFWNELE